MKLSLLIFFPRKKLSGITRQNHFQTATYKCAICITLDSWIYMHIFFILYIVIDSVDVLQQFRESEIFLTDHLNEMKVNAYYRPWPLVNVFVAIKNNSRILVFKYNNETIIPVDVRKPKLWRKIFVTNKLNSAPGHLQVYCWPRLFEFCECFKFQWIQMNLSLLHRIYWPYFHGVHGELGLATHLLNEVGRNVLNCTLPPIWCHFLFSSH